MLPTLTGWLKMGKCSWSGFVRSVKLVITFVCSHVGLCAFVAAYSVAGAFLFRELEQKHIEAYYDPVLHRNDCFHDLHAITERAGASKGILESPVWEEQVRHRLTTFEQQLVRAVQGQVYDQGPEEQRDRWSVIGSLFYCVTVITTIGYGHLSPRTWEGKLATIVYAIIGIPLMLLCLTNIGDSMATSFRFLYVRMCCHRAARQGDAALSTTQRAARQGDAAPSPTLGTAHLGDASPRESGMAVPYTPPPSYKPSRRNMLISPPISATIHRGSDNPLQPQTTLQTSRSSSKTCNANYFRSLPPHLALPDTEANRIVAECAAYSKTKVPGVVMTCHDYDLVTLSVTAPDLSTPSSHDAPADWTCRTNGCPSDDWNNRDKSGPQADWTSRATGGPHTVSEGQLEPTPSTHSTRTSSPALTTSSTATSRGCPGQGSNLYTGGLMPYGSEIDDPQYIHVRERPPGKTLVVYNTLSGDALLEQSKVARKMALMNAGGFGPVRSHVTTVFTDPISGQAVDGDMLGLNYRPIPPDTSDADNRVPIPIVLAFVVSYIGIGALLFGWLEGWTFLDAGYFCFITLSTIGFGDFVPGKSLGYETQEAQIKLVTGSLYLMFGLAVLAMSFNLVQEEVVLKCKAFALWIGLMKE